MTVGRASVAHVDGEAAPGDVYIGRASPRRRLKASPLANPFAIGDGRSRDRAIELFATETFPQFLGDTECAGGRALRTLLARMRAGEDVRLRCWCAPERCHGDVIAAWLNAGAAEHPP